MICVQIIFMQTSSNTQIDDIMKWDSQSTVKKFSAFKSMYLNDQQIKKYTAAINYFSANPTYAGSAPTAIAGEQLAKNKKNSKWW